MLGRVCLSCSCFTRNNPRAHAREEGTEQSHKCADGTWSLRTTGRCVIPAWSWGSYSSFALKTAACPLKTCQVNRNSPSEWKLLRGLLREQGEGVAFEQQYGLRMLQLPPMVYVSWGPSWFEGVSSFMLFFEGFSSSALCCYVLPVSFLSPIQLIGLAGTLLLLRPQPPRCMCDTDSSFHCSPW